MQNCRKYSGAFPKRTMLKLMRILKWCRTFIEKTGQGTDMERPGVRRIVKFEELRYNVI